MQTFTEGVMGSGRSTVYHGESAYWVNVDIDVPLFLPVYARGRLADMRKIASAEIASKRQMQGSIVFDSGWEWSYWLHDVLIARFAADPVAGVDITADYSDADMHKALRNAIFDVVVAAFDPSGGSLAEEITTLLADCIDEEYELLILGVAKHQAGNKEFGPSWKRNGTENLSQSSLISLSLSLTFSPRRSRVFGRLGYLE
jgi:hypothetical protein